MKLAIAVTLAAACAGRSSVEEVRFMNAPPVWRVDDRRDVPTAPEKREFHRQLYYFDAYYWLAKNSLALQRDRRARGINSLDEVPDSTWFTNRIGRREVSPDDIERGPGTGSPEGHTPWTVVKAKRGGTELGLIIEDTRGVKYQLKLDDTRLPEATSGADAIGTRIMWAAGYNVPADHVVTFAREDLRVGPKAGPEVGKQLDAMFERAKPGPDGKIRGLASTFLQGKVLGGTPRTGTRAGDPNDRIPHELRRDLRGQRAFFAWLSHPDIKEDQTLDVWETDPANPKHHYVVHYLLDFDWALGVYAALAERPWIDHRYAFDPMSILRETLTLGVRREPWERREPVRIRGVGLYAAAGYDPGKWKPSLPSHLPITVADRLDQFWGAKIIIRFTREQLAAAVAAARFTDPRAAPYLVDTLVKRQRITADYWFRRVNPIDDVEVENDQLCFTDLALRHRLVETATRFTATAYDSRANRIGRATATPDGRGRACVAVARPPGAQRYTIVQLASSRAGLPATLIYIADDQVTQVPRVVGLYRL